MRSALSGEARQTLSARAPVDAHHAARPNRHAAASSGSVRGALLASAPLSTPDKLWTRPFVVASIANFFHGLAVMLFLHLPGLLERWRETKLVIGLVAAAMAAGAVLVRPFAGRVMDGGGGRRVVVLVGGVGHVVACLGYFAVLRVSLLPART